MLSLENYVSNKLVTKITSDCVKKKWKRPKKKLTMPCQSITAECWSQLKKDSEARKCAEKLAKIEARRKELVQKQCDKCRTKNPFNNKENK
ncbi:hypothetical protein Trydic_g15996 [Trypoxylus dichotomus]